MSEERTKSLFEKRCQEVGYPSITNQEVNGVFIYKEDGYKGNNKSLERLFKSASKKVGSKNSGTPDFVIVGEEYKDLVIVVECKQDNDKQSSYANLEGFRQGLENPNVKKNISDYAIDGALHYASFLKDSYDVIAIGVTGKTEEEFKFQSILWGKGRDISKIEVLEDNGYKKTLMTLSQYKNRIDKYLERNNETKEEVFRELRRYATACNNFLRSNNIDASNRAGFISGIIIALTDDDFREKAESAYALKPFKDVYGTEVIESIKKALERVWKEDLLPDLKKDKLNEYYKYLFKDSLVTDNVDHTKKYFEDGNNKLSTAIYSIYKNITLKVEGHKDLDIMGTFYTEFLKYTKGEAKEKGIVLTPSHITELFCDIAEHYLGRELDESTPVLDICTGTGGFLIAALNRMFKNIEGKKINDFEKERLKEEIRTNCLLGVEFEASMFALAYANMRFHRDGRSNLYVGSSLIEDDLVVDTDKVTGEEIKLKDVLRQAKPIIGMINPPYSVDKNKSSKKKEEQKGKSELDFILSMLDYLEKGGIGIAIVPLSTASGNKGEKLRKKIMSKHSLLAVMTMPISLFQDSNVSTQTCIMVFKAHVNHNNSTKVFLGNWIDDGLRNIPHRGRIDVDNRFNNIKIEWLNQLKGEAEPNNIMYLRKELSSKDEWLVAAYLDVDYHAIEKKDFENTLKKYALAQFIADAEETVKEKDKIYWFIDNMKEFENKYSNAIHKEQIDLKCVGDWQPYKLSNIFEIHRAYPYNRRTLPKTVQDITSIPCVTRTAKNNGVDYYADFDETLKIEQKNSLTIGAESAVCFYQKKDFVCGTNITVLRNDFMNEYSGLFVSHIINEYSKGRYNFYSPYSFKRVNETVIKLPSKLNSKGEYEPDWEYMGNYIKSLPYSSAL